ncbi:hypothetical protein ACN38_g3160 [Penicillium nordicum]|uniref:Uncharacterized protein n=1 Tax=Penicillium nordicum TaxID=229535 RepID=A0A0M8PE61_9EURO|nr:hypothetical protein ACN38_g3160 [Penicillium nordicum]
MPTKTYRGQGSNQPLTIDDTSLCMEMKSFIFQHLRPLENMEIPHLYGAVRNKALRHQQPSIMVDLNPGLYKSCNHYADKWIYNVTLFCMDYESPASSLLRRKMKSPLECLLRSFLG